MIYATVTVHKTVQEAFFPYHRLGSRPEVTLELGWWKRQDLWANTAEGDYSLIVCLQETLLLKRENNCGQNISHHKYEHIDNGCVVLRFLFKYKKR